MRKSRQRGWIKLRGKKWYGYFRKAVVDPTTNEQKRMTAAVVLGLQTQMDKAEAREVLDFLLFKETGSYYRGGVWVESPVTFGWFVRNRYLPLKEAMWKTETAKIKKLLIERDLIEAFDGMQMKTLDKFRLQVHLNNLARKKSKDRVLQVRAYLRDIFAEASEQGFIDKDPARRLRAPVQLREVDRTVLTWEQLRRVLAHLSLRDRLLLELAMTNALRPSELFALKWKCFNHEAQTITLSETVYKGKVRPWGKTRRSLGVIHIPQQLADDLLLWKQQFAEAAPDAFIFSNSQGSFISSDAFRKQTLSRLARDLQLPKLTFQVLRRTIATLAQRKGSVKDIQGILRHSSASTTADIYMQETSEGIQRVLLSISNELRADAFLLNDDQSESLCQLSTSLLEDELSLSR